ncbi:MAG TPA: 2OG-Fe(II) oxygenase [Solirubrobacterales bacterium]|nr:2OG-Fe(II) oxygenase [Solirubrobacterales bacterium]
MAQHTEEKLTSGSTWFPRLLRDETSAELHEWFTSSPSRPETVSDVLEPDLADRLAAELRETTRWRHQYWVLNDQEWTDEVDAATFEATDPARRFSSNQALSDGSYFTSADLSLTGQFVRALGDGALAQAFAAVVDEPLNPTPIVEFARYERGHFLAEHSDTFEDRRIGMVLYLSTPGWQPEFGGQLGYRNERGEESLSEPHFNTAALFPFRTDCSHWVNPLATDEGVRYSVAVHFRASE